MHNAVAFVTAINSLWEWSAAAYGNGLQQLLALFEKDRIVHRKYNPSYSKVFGSTELGSLPVEY